MKAITAVYTTVFALCITVTSLAVKTAYDIRIKISETPVQSPEPAKSKLRQLECLALNIYREAGHEPFEGKVAVAQVTINRSNNPAFPKDVCDVVYQKTVVMEKVICQFSWYCDVKHRTKPIDKDAYNESLEVAKKVYLENFRLTNLSEALYYHADYVNPKWNKVRIAKYGKHIFYK